MDSQPLPSLIFTQVPSSEASEELPHSPSLSDRQLQQLSPAQLAYIGDGVYELWIRLHYLWPPRRLQQYHQQVVAQVRAENQAHHLQQIQAQLMPEELEMVRRGRNAAGGKPRRLNAETYGQASGFETLLGYLYLTDQSRLQTLLQYLEIKRS